MPFEVESPRPTASNALFNHIHNRYGIEFESSPKDLGGSRNLNLLLTSHGRKFVARIYRAWIAAPRLAAIQAVRHALRLNGVPSSVVQPTLWGEAWTSHNGCLIEIENYVEHDANMDTWERLAVGLPFLGRAHSVLKTINVAAEARQPMIANHLGSEAVAEVTQRGVDRIRTWSPTTDQSRFIAAAEALAHRLPEAEEPFIGKLPTQLVHGDFWDNNVLFDNNKVVLVTDLDFMGERPRIDDLALTLYYTNSTFADDQLSGNRIQHLRVLVDAYDLGLDEPLSTIERRALPLAIARTPLFMLRYFSLMASSEIAARPMAETLPDLEWALELCDNLRRWQEIFSA